MCPPQESIWCGPNKFPQSRQGYLEIHGDCDIPEGSWIILSMVNKDETTRVTGSIAFTRTVLGFWSGQVFLGVFVIALLFIALGAGVYVWWRCHKRHDRLKEDPLAAPESKPTPGAKASPAPRKLLPQLAKLKKVLDPLMVLHPKADRQGMRSPIIARKEPGDPNGAPEPPGSPTSPPGHLNEPGLPVYINPDKPHRPPIQILTSNPPLDPGSGDQLATSSNSSSGSRLRLQYSPYSHSEGSGADHPVGETEPPTRAPRRPRPPVVIALQHPDSRGSSPRPDIPRPQPPPPPPPPHSRPNSVPRANPVPPQPQPRPHVPRPRPPVKR
eukprot:TRINITY_DN4405_c0_g1_i1.p1 TRINITY_DN4405_c0_g1~~TRINITY_DN4405_c0_g1_i1.p1  ORF type:complete len:327 (+),score=44.71 TRINITY_DN4405_c0_g1_i1:170-1150(+)